MLSRVRQLLHHLHGVLLLAAGGAQAEDGGQVHLKQACPGKPIFGFFHTIWFQDWLLLGKGFLLTSGFLREDQKVFLWMQFLHSTCPGAGAGCTGV